MIKPASIIVTIIICALAANAQIVFNEASNRNYTQILDEDEETNDWIELYNAGSSSTNLKGWFLSDSRNNYQKWQFGDIDIPSGGFILLHASGKDLSQNQNEKQLYWETAVFADDNFRYTIPDNSTPSNWKNIDFDHSSWDEGKGGFGYGDGDDETEVPAGSLAVYIRREFNVTDASKLFEAALHIDYDDGFVAYLNGQEIARSNINGIPAWNSRAAGNHEAGEIEKYTIEEDELKSILVSGKNVFCVEVHNVSNTSSDMSLIPYLSFGMMVNESFFRPVPGWFGQNSIGTGGLHTNFKISNDGEWVFLSDPTGLVDSMYVDEVQIDHTTGRATDGASEWATFAEATPGASNNPATAYINGYADEPHFSQEAGFYNSYVTLKLLTGNKEAEIRYTTDGSDPTSSSSLYTEAITIRNTTCIKARCFVTGKLPGKAIASTYFINDEYTIPVLSLTTNKENLYGSTGIFHNHNESWNRPCYIEYFDEDKALVVSQASGIQVDGGAGGSRHMPQTSFRIEPDHGTLGEGAVKYNFHPERLNRNEYEYLYLRNGSNRYLDLFYKDGAQVRGMGKNTHNFYSEYRPIVVFINGEYYGMYEGREKIKADYLENNYDMNTDSLTMVGISYFKEPNTILPIVGSAEPFFEDYERFLDMDPSGADYLDKVDEFLDLDCYTDYMAGQTWMTNKDWPHNNMKAWRCKGSGMRWQFAIVDLEWSFMPTGSHAHLVTRPSFDQIAYMNSIKTQWPASGYWYRLMQNEDYKNRFINRMCDLMNTSYAYEELSKIETAIYEEALPEIPAYYERWNGPGVDDFINNHELFNSELEKRPAYVQEHLMKHYNLTRKVAITLDVEPQGAGSIQISTIIPDAYPWEGTYFSDVDIEITAIPNMGYKFEKWDDNSFINDIYSASNVGELKTAAYNMKAYFTEDSESPDRVLISEINYKPNEIGTPDWFEIYNATNESFNIKDWYFMDNDSTHVFTFLLDRIIESGERLVVSNNPQQFSSVYPEVDAYFLGFGFGLGSPSDEIHLYNDQNEKVFSVKYSDLHPWPLANNNEGRTLELRNANGDFNEPIAWFRGCIGGSPGTGYQHCDENIPNSNSRVVSNTGKEVQIRVFPNPANTYVDFEMYLPVKVHFCDAAIFDLNGRRLRTASYGQLKQGEYTNRFDLDGIKPGILILKVWTDLGENVLKVVRLDN